MDSIVINPLDNVSVSLENGHKYALTDIKEGEQIMKYGFPIGKATADIKKGEPVHSHNLKTELSGLYDYAYKPVKIEKKDISPLFINAFERKSGEIGIRNDIWIIPSVGCVNKIAEELSKRTGAFCFTHPYGCSQLGGDALRTVQILCSLIKHPNAGGVLVLGLGCENNNISVIKSHLGEYDRERIRFLNVQAVDDELKEGERIINLLKGRASDDKRTKVSISRLKIGLKCGGSDGLSGITANPLVGKITDKICAFGGIAVLTEVPEMFGAEQLLLNRCENKTVFDKAVKMINNCKTYFISHNQPISENPSPGNKEGGITTLEEKSLGCVQKGGKAVITDVLDYGDTASKSGLNLLNGPGNDIVAITNLTAVGCHLILFTTGRGTPLGAPVPTVKISSNTRLANAKGQWIDFDAQTGNDEELFELLINTANGNKTRNEENGYREIAIFKDGVTL
ncbi:MAG: altronate dehydratase [Ruminococcaceae bacterium]|jgi:altronate hydrolase|nr:altronate dehydratase [Oscillospiraceae bacterium]